MGENKEIKIETNMYKTKFSKEITISRKPGGETIIPRYHQ